MASLGWKGLRIMWASCELKVASPEKYLKRCDLKSVSLKRRKSTSQQTILDDRVQLFLHPHLVITEHALSQLQKVILESQSKPHREECFSYEDKLQR